MDTATLTARLRAAHDYLTGSGWTQKVWGSDDDQGRTDLTGAIARCGSVDTGAPFVINAVLDRRGRGADWNDAPGRTGDDVLTLLATAEITDRDMVGTFGPAWEQVTRIIEQAAVLTLEQAELVSVKRQATSTVGLELHVRQVAGAAGRMGQADAAGYTAGHCARATGWSGRWRFGLPDATAYAAEDFARAEAVRDLIYSDIYAAYAAPWRAAFPH